MKIEWSTLRTGVTRAAAIVLTAGAMLTVAAPARAQDLGIEPTLLAAAKKYGSQVKFIGVAVSVNETPARVKAFVDKHSLPGDHFFDAKGNATGAYDAPATSYVVVINKAGKVVYTGLGGKQDLEAAIKKAL